MHAPPSPHMHPLSPHMPPLHHAPPSNHACPPSPCMPPSPRMPPFTMHAPLHHACPPSPPMPPSNHACPPPVDRILDTRFWKYYLAPTLLRAVKNPVEFALVIYWSWVRSQATENILISADFPLHHHKSSLNYPIGQLTGFLLPLDRHTCQWENLKYFIWLSYFSIQGDTIVDSADTRWGKNTPFWLIRKYFYNYCPLEKFSQNFLSKAPTVADLVGSAPGATPPTYGPKFSQFHAVFCKIWQHHMLAPPLEGWRPLLQGILYPPLARLKNSYRQPLQN